MKNQLRVSAIAAMLASAACSGGGGGGGGGGGTGPDTTPNAFSFTDQSGIQPSVQVTSNAVTISGINAPAGVTVSGGSYSIGCNGTFTTSAGSISAGQTVCVRHTSSSAPSSQVNTTLNIGGVVDTFTSTTVSQTATLIWDQSNWDQANWQ